MDQNNQNNNYQDPYQNGSGQSGQQDGQQNGQNPYGTGFNQGQYYYSNQTVNDTAGSTSKTLGIVALVCLFCCQLASVICGAIAMAKANESRRLNNGIRTPDSSAGYIMGLIGVILGILSVIGSIVLSILYVALFFEYASDPGAYNQTVTSLLALL